MKLYRQPVNVPNHAGEIVYRGNMTVPCCCSFKPACLVQCDGACSCRACANEWREQHAGSESWEDEAAQR